MKVFKFGGASVKDAAGVRNLAAIVARYPEELVVVVSAMGKTTNALEELTRSYFNKEAESVKAVLTRLMNYHFDLVEELFDTNRAEIEQVLNNEFNALKIRLDHTPSLDYDFEYDQIVSLGEVFSTQIVSAYLNQKGQLNQWLDIRRALRTDANWREGGIDWGLSAELVKASIRFNTQKIFITQGFIGSTVTDQTTTLGREGSDYTAAILANILEAESVTIWKDVPGIMNADPNKYPNTEKLDMLSYREAVEMTYYGAKVIHPKTMKPLVEKEIPLYVKSFLAPEEPGSVICRIDHPMNYVPVIILKEDLILITISHLDFSFIVEESIGEIYRLLSQFRIKVNLVQQSAMNFSIAIDKPERNFEKLIQELKRKFTVHYNEGLELLTIRYYQEDVVRQMTAGRTVFVAQKTRTTSRFLIK